MALAKKSLADYLDADKSEESSSTESINSSIMVIPALLLKARTDVHLTHLKQKDRTLATHNALSIFYDGILGFADTFIETSMGIYPNTSLMEVEESCVITNPLQYFNNLYKTIDKARATVKESFLQNQIDEIQQLIAHTLYRLQFITT